MAGEETILARWAVDATGVRALLARQEGWYRVNEAHPTAALWSRWSGVKNLDGLELADKYPEWAAKCYGLRHMATNHLMGDGWWTWLIPLKGGDMSIGLVYDQRLVRVPPGASHRGADALVPGRATPDGGGNARRRPLAGGRHSPSQESAVLQHDVRRGRLFHRGRRGGVHRPVL